MKNFTQRTITGLLYVAVIIASVYFHPFAFIAVLTVIMVIAMAELYKLITADNIEPQVVTGIGTGVVMLVSTSLFASGILPGQILSVPLLLIFLLFFFELFRRDGKTVNNLAFSLFGLIYIAFPLSLLPLLGYPKGLSEGYTPDIILGYFILIWLYDTGAYITGSFTGKHKIMETISPGKSWEGFLSGLVISIGVAFAIAELFPILKRTDWIIIAAVSAVAGTFGDFIESGIKRNAGVKDSGSLLPGHGGMLDRIDSVLLSVPFVFIFLLIRYHL